MGLFAKLIPTTWKKTPWCNSCRRQTSRWSCTRLPMSSPSFPIAARCLSSWRYALPPPAPSSSRSRLFLSISMVSKPLTIGSAIRAATAFWCRSANDSPLSRAGKISLYRLGGDEFLIVGSAQQPAAQQAYVTSLRQALCGAYFLGELCVSTMRALASGWSPAIRRVSMLKRPYALPMRRCTRIRSPAARRISFILTKVPRYPVSCRASFVGTGTQS